MPDFDFNIPLQTLRNAGIVAVPTDTVYGLAVDPKNRMAVQKLYHLKRRDSNKPLVYMIAAKEQLRELAREITPEVEKIIAEYWPGALTIIFREKYNSGTIGIRIPDNKFLLGLLKEWGKPLAVTSANISGEPELQSMEEIEQKFGETIDLYIYDAAKLTGKASTVIDVSQGELKVVREGAIKIC